MFVTIITFFIILSVLVLVHELGHFLVARYFGVAVEEFGLGLPPRIIGKKIKGTIYSINWLPIGGFVKLAGEDDEEVSSAKLAVSSKSELKKYFWARSKKIRAAILLAGVFMNFILAVAVTTYLLTQGVPELTERVHIDKVLPNGPAAAAGLKEGDIIKSIQYAVSSMQTETKEIKSPKELIDTTKEHLGEEITLTIIRDGTTLSVVTVPRKEYPEGQGPMGIAITNLETRKYPILDAPWQAFKINIDRIGIMVTSVAAPLWKLITFQPVCGEVAGPIGIYRVTGETVKYGVSAVLELVSILSLNLAVLNVLPIPALDGGRLAFVFLEKFRGRKIKPAFERSAHQTGMIIIFILILLISINDLICPPFA